MENEIKYRVVFRTINGNKFQRVFDTFEDAVNYAEPVKDDYATIDIFLEQKLLITEIK